MAELYPVTQADIDAAAEYTAKFPELTLKEAFAKHRCEALKQAAAVAGWFEPRTADDAEEFRAACDAASDIAVAILSLRTSEADHG